MSNDAPSTDFTLSGHGGDLVGRAWDLADARWIAVLAHGYGEHVGRYAWVAARLRDAGAAVYAADHVGHGRSDGERVLIEDFEPVVADLDLVVGHARDQHPELPIVLIGHSLGGMIAARYTQVHPESLVATVLSGPVLGSWAIVDELLALEEIPPTPIDPAVLSRDPMVGSTYAEDDLVWHGDFKRPTLEAIQRSLRMITAAGTVGDHPLLYLHGEGDELVPLPASRAGLSALEGAATRVRTYPGARHEIFQETNRDEVLADVTAFVDEVLEARG
ncbi:alpha/beta fold hydrolase [Brachybacterium sacelli]|uniref:Alpha-beta hydrolase superfamily lysophospholipase n=1 Tax=Brachybacterium sacelli TaxID=173364 RepID=A0ABS4WXF0_9MICO|nr:alpha/beta fold hydrolase [Brachybacterium sacelli]MBP2380771.1 alpha-beta hydrolase superfamily lysophospholipase [Brachybacterium sacelli]